MSYWTEGGRRIGVLGLGRSGRAASGLLVARGFTVVGLDEGAGSFEVPSCAEVITGPEVAQALPGLDGLVVSPGVDPAKGIAAAAIEMGLPVLGEVELAFRNTRVPVLAVTGANGKTTTSEWLGHVLRTAGIDAVVAGNTGYPFCTAVMESPQAAVFVVEVSSYQLQTTSLFHPVGAAILNITPDHLQRHGDMEGYRMAKSRIFVNQSPGDMLALNSDDPGSIPLTGRTGGMEWLFSTKGPVPSGAFAGGGILYSVLDGERREVIPVSGIGLKGEHNLSNAAAVVCLALKAGVAPEAMGAGLADFPGVPHRIEWIRSLEGVDWYNDSKSTNPDSLAVALKSFSRPLVLIAGGRAKIADYSELAPLLRGKVRSIILMGEATGMLEEAWDGVAPVFMEGDLERAVSRAFESAREGDAVLLSPACASFDQYSNFEERGEHFRKLVEKLR
jgi:UDP-N-acetylmuramoylalanine--D-glutamate ligase